MAGTVKYLVYALVGVVFAYLLLHALPGAERPSGWWLAGAVATVLALYLAETLRRTIRSRRG